MRRCKWVNLTNPLYVHYHDNEWSQPEHNDSKLYEMLLLESFQAGLSWECILKKREAFRRAFNHFDVSAVAAYTIDDEQRLMADTSIVRNRLKIKAAIKNSEIFMNIQQEFGSFDRYLWSFTDGKVMNEPYNLQTTSPLSDRLSNDLRHRGMKFVGSTIIYSYLQAVGIINAHGEECDLYRHADSV